VKSFSSEIAINSNSVMSVFRVLEPDNNATSPYIDLSYQPTMLIPLAQVRLIDAESVDPNHSREAVVAKPLQRRIQTFCDRELA
jgi:hypothetical protein